MRMRIWEADGKRLRDGKGIFRGRASASLASGADQNENEN